MAAVQLRKQIEAAAEIDTRATTVGQLPTSVNLTLYQGDDFFLRIVVTGQPPPDLTLYTAKAEIRVSANTSTVLATFDATIVDAVTVGLHLPADQSKLLTTPAVWDVQVTDPAGIITTLAYGTVTVTREVTR